jgi:hypothetical protein
MKNVTLYFPDSVALFDFILNEKVKGVTTYSNICSLEGILSDQQIVVACTKYQAYVEGKLLTAKDR